MSYLWDFEKVKTKLEVSQKEKKIHKLPGTATWMVLIIPYWKVNQHWWFGLECVEIKSVYWQKFHLKSLVICGVKKGEYVCSCCIALTWRKDRKITGHGDMLKFSERLESQHQEKTLLLRGAALASLFTIHKIQVSLSNSVQAFHISVVCRQTSASSLLLSVFGFPILKLGSTWGTLLQSLFKYSLPHSVVSSR